VGGILAGDGFLTPFIVARQDRSTRYAWRVLDERLDEGVFESSIFAERSDRGMARIGMGDRRRLAGLHPDPHSSSRPDISAMNGRGTGRGHEWPARLLVI
jgi:hypothetical protein